MNNRRSPIVECPHCHTNIIPLANNICPACQRDLSDPTDTEPNKISFIIHESEELPSYCHSCGVYTERTVRVSGDDESFFGPGLFRSTVPEDTSNVIIFIPQCENCAELDDPEPVAVDYDTQTMTFLVHPSFGDRVTR